MKKLFVTIAVLLITLTAFSQTVNGIPLNEIESDYIQITARRNSIGWGKLRVDVDAGQKQSALKTKDTLLLDAEGNPIKFNSIMDLLNMFIENGFEYVDRGMIEMGSSIVYSYLLRKRQ